MDLLAAALRSLPANVQSSHQIQHICLRKGELETKTKEIITKKDYSEYSGDEISQRTSILNVWKEKTSVRI